MPLYVVLRFDIIGVFSLTEGLRDAGEKALYQLGGLMMLVQIDAAGTTHI